MLARSPRIVGAAWLVGAALLGCLRVFGPDLRTVGVHAGVRPGEPRETCMGCHESEADAIVRMREHGPRAEPAHAPLVADWMITESRECSVCHVIRVRESHAR